MFNSLYIVYHNQKLYGPLESENSTNKENWKIMYTYFYTCPIYYSSVGADNLFSVCISYIAPKELS